MNIYFTYIVVAAILDICANLLLEKSDGFQNKKYGVPALVLVCLAFTLLAQATQEIDLTIAYVSWGAMAILGTTFLSRMFFGQKLNWVGWLGMCAIFASIVLLKTA